MTSFSSFTSSRLTSRKKNASQAKHELDPEIEFIDNTRTLDSDNNRIIDNDSESRKCELRIPFKSLAVATATTQISSLAFCLAWSVKFNFYESTATHCRVANYLPSLSATLDFTPQRDVWRSCIGLSGVPRYLIAYLYYYVIFKSKTLLCLHCTEITALIGLSIVDSIRYFTFHATCVGIFLLTSILHMAMVCSSYVTPTSFPSVSETMRHTLEQTKSVKKRIAVINFFAIVTALYLYDRHNRYCEPGVYSAFSFLEYIVIVANIVYHLQAYYDLSEYSFLVARIDDSMNVDSKQVDIEEIGGAMALISFLQTAVSSVLSYGLCILESWFHSKVRPSPTQIHASLTFHSSVMPV